MGKTITSIKNIKKKNAYVVSFGLETLTLSEDTYTDHFLYVGKDIPLKEFYELQRSSETEKVYEYALSLSLKGCYSSFEIKEKIKKKLPEGESPSSIINRLKKNNLLDDMELARLYKEEKEAQLYGKGKIKDDLLHKKMIDENIVNSLSFLSEEEHARKWAEMNEKKYDSLPLKEKRNKAIQSLLRRGFSKEVASIAISSYKENEKKSKEKLLRDYENLSRRYKSKYSGYEYKNHLFQALLRRGYSSKNINEIMEDEIYVD